MDVDLPVWTVRPNWAGGVLERLEWKTDVLASESGAEQRRALRFTPRRYVEITINPSDEERSYVDLLLHKLGSVQWLLPLWFDRAELATAAPHDATRVTFDNTYREHLNGGFALLWQDAFTWEVISIASQDAAGLNLAAQLDGTWPAGTVLYPLRRAQLPDTTSLESLSAQVGESVLLWQIVEANPHVETAPSGATFEGRPIITQVPNRSENITLDHTRLSTTIDNETGIPYRVDTANRAFQAQSHSWLHAGRQAQFEFKSMLYWLRGQQRSVWLPSFNDDFTVSRSANLGARRLDIRKIGLSYVGVNPGRDVIYVKGRTPARITGLEQALSSKEERLVLEAGMGAALSAGTTGSFLSSSRLNQDTIEITHHADSNGLMECSITFKTFSDTRNPAGVIYVPIPGQS